MRRKRTRRRNKRKPAFAFASRTASLLNRRLHVESLEDRRMLAVFSVDNLNDSGTGSLREAITLANADTVADEIIFSVTGTIDLTSQLHITQPLTITGPGAELLTLDAGDGDDDTFATGDGYRLFLINGVTTIDVEISGLTLTGGDTTAADFGGAIQNFENLTITSSSIARNSSGTRGGGIYNTGSVTVIESTIEGNNSSSYGGGINSFFGNTTIKSSTLSGNTATGRGGGVYTSIASTTTITGSTLSGNLSGTFGGAITVVGTLNLANSTVTSNEAVQSAGGIRIIGSATVNATSSIVAGNMAGSNINIHGSLNTTTQNLIDVDPLLGPLADNGGPTKTHALLPGSPALDAGLAPVHVYELEGFSFADAMGGPALAPLGGSIFASGGYDFGPNEGLNLSSANIDPAEYTIEFDFSFAALSGFQKVIDFKDLVADTGLYTLNDTLRFFGPNAFSGSIFTVDTLHRLVLSRDGSTDVVRASIDGTEAFSFIDTSEFAVFSETDQIIRFFQDDTATSQNEAVSGFVDRIRIFDTALESNDQRGSLFARVAGEAIDIGAYEAQSAPSADFDSDGGVDGADFLSWQRGFGKPGAQLSDGNSDDDMDTDASDLAAWQVSFGHPLPPPPSADFDSSGFVTSFDFLAWQRGFGTPNAVKIDGDADDDGNVDSTDLGFWESQFGDPAPLAPIAAAIASDDVASPLESVAVVAQPLVTTTQSTTTPTSAELASVAQIASRRGSDFNNLSRDAALLQANRFEVVDRAFGAGSLDKWRNDFDSLAHEQRDSIRTLANHTKKGIHAQATDDLFATLAEDAGLAGMRSPL